MTEAEIQVAFALEHVRMGWKTQKPVMFTVDIIKLARGAPNTPLRPTQRKYLADIAFRYRTQLPANILVLAALMGGEAKQGLLL